MILENDNDRLMLIAAFRYSIGRRSYITSSCVEVLHEQWETMSESDKKLVHREIKEAVETGCAGDSCDISTWESILQLNV